MTPPAPPVPEPEPGILPDPAFDTHQKVCIRCGQPIGGLSYSTFYGVLRMADGCTRQGVGEPVHWHCPNGHTAPDPVPAQEPAPPHTHYVKVATEIYLNPNSGRCLAYYRRKAVGSFADAESAQHARALFKRHSDQARRGALAAKTTRRQKRRQKGRRNA